MCFRRIIPFRIPNAGCQSSPSPPVLQSPSLRSKAKSLQALQPSRASGLPSSPPALQPSSPPALQPSSPPALQPSSPPALQPRPGDLQPSSAALQCPTAFGGGSKVRWMPIARTKQQSMVKWGKIAKYRVVLFSSCRLAGIGIHHTNKTQGLESLWAVPSRQKPIWLRLTEPERRRAMTCLAHTNMLVPHLWN